MSAILRRLPFFRKTDEVTVGMERIRIRAYQIIVWVSMTADDVIELPATARRFPAILDTGHNHNFSIQHKHLVSWAGIDPDLLTESRKIREGQREAELYPLMLWFHANEPGHRDRFADQDPSLSNCREVLPSTPEK